MISEWLEPQCPLARALYILDLWSTQSAKQERDGVAPERKKPEGDKPLLERWHSARQGVPRRRVLRPRCAFRGRESAWGIEDRPERRHL